MFLSARGMSLSGHDVIELVEISGISPTRLALVKKLSLATGISLSLINKMLFELRACIFYSKSFSHSKF